VLAPLIDSVNHRSSVPTDIDFDSLRGRFRVKVARDYKAGEQVRHAAFEDGYMESEVWGVPAIVLVAGA
jgi:hypothetical protein